MNNQEIAKLLFMAKAAFPGRSPEGKQELEYLTDVWRAVLNGIPHDLTEAALYKVLSTAKFFPAVAEIREAAISLVPGPPTAEEAWEEVRKVITSGHCSIKYQYNDWRPEWTHDLINKTVNEMGLRELFDSENMSITMAQFKKYYEANKSNSREKKLNNQIIKLTGLTGLLESKETEIDKTQAGNFMRQLQAVKEAI